MAATGSALDAGAYVRIEGSGHGVFGQNIEKAGPAMEEFFDRVLRGKE